MANRVDDLQAWRVFVTYAETGSLSTCGEVMGIEPSSVSRTIEALEKGIGQELVLHNSRPMELTEVGIKAKKHIEPILRAHQKFLEALASDSAALKGHIRVSVAPGFASRRLMPFLTDFAKLYPNIDIDVVTGFKEPDIAKGRCDLGVLTGVPTLPNLVYMYRGRNIYLPVASPQYISEHGMPLHPHDLAKHIVYAYNGPVRPETKTLCRGNDEVPPNLDRVVRMADITTIRQAVIAGNGIRYFYIVYPVAVVGDGGPVDGVAYPCGFHELKRVRKRDGMPDGAVRSIYYAQARFPVIQVFSDGYQVFRWREARIEKSSASEQRFLFPGIQIHISDGGVVFQGPARVGYRFAPVHPVVLFRPCQHAGFAAERRNDGFPAVVIDFYQSAAFVETFFQRI